MRRSRQGQLFDGIHQLGMAFKQSGGRLAVADDKPTTHGGESLPITARTWGTAHWNVEAAHLRTQPWIAATQRQWPAAHHNSPKRRSTPEKTTSGCCHTASVASLRRMKKRRWAPRRCMKGVPGVMQLLSNSCS